MKIRNLNQSPYLISYTPQPSPAGTIYVSLVKDMVAYNISSSITSSLNYDVGAFENYSFDLIVKNITTNTNLTITVDGNPYFTTPSSSVTLLPLEQKNIPISISKSNLENIAGTINNPFSIKINTTNHSGSVTLRDTTTSIPTQSTLPTTILIR
jgi:hypothetical protein